MIRGSGRSWLQTNVRKPGLWGGISSIFLPCRWGGQGQAFTEGSVQQLAVPASACYPSSVFIAMGQIRAMQPLGFKEMVKMKVLCKDQCAVQMWTRWQWLCLWFPLGIRSGRRQWATELKSMASDQADLCDPGAVKPPLQASVLSSVKWVHYPHSLSHVDVCVR